MLEEEVVVVAVLQLKPLLFLLVRRLISPHQLVVKGAMGVMAAM